MTRQYIGARYVPKFDGTYDPSKKYEALTIVDDGLGSSYTSKQPVPPGTPLNNTTYWALTGSLSGAITSLQNRMSAAENNIDAMERNIIVIGNSYVNRGCADLLKACFKNAYQNWENGTGFLTYSSVVIDFEDQLDTMIADTSIDPDTITDIIFVSAIGDTRAYTGDPTNYEANLKIKLADIRTKIVANYPNCKYIKISHAGSHKIPALSDETYASFFAVHHIFSRVCDNAGFEYIGWAGWNVMLDAAFFTDNIHPNALGAIAIGTWLKNSYFGNAQYAKRYASFNNVPVDYTSGTKAIGNITLTPDRADLFIRRWEIVAGAITTAANKTLIDTHDFPFPFPPAGGNLQLYGDLRKTGDNSLVEFMTQLLTPDTDGVALIKNSIASSLSTIAANTYAYFQPTCLLSYEPI